MKWLYKIGGYSYMENNNFMDSKEVSLSALKEHFVRYDMIVIYGAGIYGTRLLRQIYNWGIEKDIVFAETNVLEEKNVNGISVYPINDFSTHTDNFCVIIAASAQYSFEMVQKLKLLGINNFYTLSEASRAYLKGLECVQFDPVISELKKERKMLLNEVNNFLEQFKKVTEHLFQQNQKNLTLYLQQQEVQLFEKLYTELSILGKRLDKLEQLIVMEVANSEKLDRIQRMLSEGKSNE